MADHSATNIILIDFENVQPKDVTPLHDREVVIRLFHGANQTKTTISLSDALLPLGRKAKWIPIVGTGPNALDFHIAFYIGKLAAEFPGAKFCIVSKDRGFDPLIAHLAQLKPKPITCTRLQSLSDIQAILSALPNPAPDFIQKRVEQLLSQKSTKPRKRNSLETHVKQHLGRYATQPNIAAVFDALQQRGVKILADGKVEWPAPATA